MNYRLPLIFLSFFFFLILMYGVFLYVSIAKPKYYKEPILQIKESAIRGSILTTNNYTLAKSEKIYGVYIDPKYVNPLKKELFIKLFSIYTNIPENTIIKKLNSKKTILLAKVDLKTKQNLYYLRKVLDKKRVFLTKNGVRLGYGIISLGYERVYPYNDTFEPFLGRFRNDLKVGENGIEDYYESFLKAKKDGIKKGYRDVFGNLIYDKDTIIKRPINGSNIQLNIDLVLQKKIEQLLDKEKKAFNVKEIVAAVMDSKTGKILAIASSNRYNPNKITKKDIPNMKISAIREVFEPGSVMKPITFAILLEKNLVNPYEIIKGYNGIWKPKWRKKPIRDDEKFDWLSAEDVIVYSSNIGISQLALRLTNKDFRDYLLKFGFSKLSGIDLPYEIKGKIKSLGLLNYPIYKTTTSYGYGILVNFVQLLKAYNVFNNYGITFYPRIANTQTKAIRVISAKNAILMLKILRKVVLKGTGKNANIDGVFIAGKTGTAHISINKKYKNIYNSSFFGFANDKFHRYTIGVTFFHLKEKFPNYFASNSAVPTFRKIVEIMIEEGLLRKEK